MYEFHGWATIQSDEELVPQQINKRIHEYAWGHGVLELRAVNGTYHLWTSGFMNHKSQEANEVLELFRYIGQLDPDAYGLLYAMDDEDPNGLNNEFRVFVLARGKLHERRDPFLSPFIPVVEDEE